MTVHRTITLFALTILITSARAQSADDYTAMINKANSLFLTKQYQQSADAFTQAFAAYGGRGYSDDRYTAACAWALTGNRDSAFAQLDHIAFKANFRNIDRMMIDSDLEALYGDARWKRVTEQVKKNKAKADADDAAYSKRIKKTPPKKSPKK